MRGVRDAKDYHKESITLEGKEIKELKAPNDELCSKAIAHDYE